MKKKRYDDDDGRTIVDMSFTGRSYYDNREKYNFPGEKKEDGGEQEDIRPPLTKKETWGVMLAALKAALLIGLIFVAGAALLILFCIYVWFK